MSRSAWTVVLIVILTFGACAGSQDYPLEIEVIDGVRTVNNPDYPRRSDSPYELVEELSIGIIEGEDAYMFNRLFDLNVDEAGYTYILLDDLWQGGRDEAGIIYPHPAENTGRSDRP